MKTFDEQFQCPSQLTWDVLQQAKYAFITPFSLVLKEGVFQSEKVLRILPRKRVIAFGTWKGKQVVAKIFFNPKRAKRHMETEIAGVNVLLEHHIPTPEVYYQDTSQDGRLYVLIFERLVSAKPFEEIWKTKESIASIREKLASMFTEFAKHHEMGVMQKDPNLKNYMLSADKIYMLDGADVEAQSKPISKAESIQNLAIFFSQFGREIEAQQKELFQYYANMRQMVIDDSDIVTLLALTKQHTEGRLKRLEKRIFSECRYFSRIKSSGHVGMLDRRYAAPELLKFLHQPGLLLPMSNHSAPLRLDKRDFIVTQFKSSFWQRLLSCFGKSKAYQTWKTANVAHFWGTLATKPIAFIEKKRFGFCCASYYVEEAKARYELI